MTKDDSLGPEVAALAQMLRAIHNAAPGSGKSQAAQLGRLIGTLPPFPGHYLYIYNYREGRILHHQGLAEVLGYPDGEVSLGTLYHAFHPEDAPALSMLAEQVIGAMSRLRNPRDPFSMAWTVDYRIRRKDGTYIKVLRQTMVFEMDRGTGDVISTISLCKDISAEHTSNVVGWRIHGPDEATISIGKLTVILPKLQYRPSRREMEVVRELAKGKSSKEIAATLNISVLTVATHRRNLLERTGTHNTPELVRQAMEQGWM